ncbi:MAG: hypothetical protein EOO97_00065 [Pedobacter sp.]|nr:MAG: hypothetical protein EOO97_00065 [Pedobacter sp.]
MSCISIAARPLACGAEGNMGGLQPKLYMISHQDLGTVSGTTTYTTSSAGMVNAIGLDASKKYVEVGLLKNTASMAETMTKNQQTASLYFTQTLTMVLGGLSIENRTFIDSVKNQPVSVLIQTRSGSWYVAGLNGLFELATVEGGTGTAEGDLNGYNLTFTGVDTDMMKLVDPTIVAGLIA